jgi:hypothetical protein
LVATTNAITQWSAVVPFLWVIPLSVYLVTFIVTFAYPGSYHRLAFGGVFMLLAGTAFLQPVPESSYALFQQLVLQTAILFAGCMICHGELVRLQPEPARLPKFYLAVAAGGALGGICVVLLAPFLFSDYYEHPLVLTIIAAVALFHMVPRAQPRVATLVIGGLSILAAVFFVGSLAAGFREELTGNTVVERVRNFYGVVKVVRRNQNEPEIADMALLQAGIDQGGQYTAPERRMQTICGFGKESGLGLALDYQANRRENQPLRIGVIGLGAGMIASLAKEGDTLRYYEINPGVLHLTSRHFTFLKESKAKLDVLLGDARLVLERQLKNSELQNFDVLVLDAFRGASPPMHLMTKEAFGVYLSHLSEDGILAVNFELDTFEVAPLHRGMAKQFGLNVRWVETPSETEECAFPVSWALYTKDKAFFDQRPVRKMVSLWRDRGKSELVWTDQDSNLMSIINWTFE